MNQTHWSGIAVIKWWPHIFVLSFHNIYCACVQCSCWPLEVLWL